MKSNIKRLSLCLSALMLLILAKSADCTCSRGRGGCICEILRHILVVGSAACCHCTGTDHQRSIQFTVCRNTGWCTVLSLILISKEQSFIFLKAE